MRLQAVRVRVRVRVRVKIQPLLLKPNVCYCAARIISVDLNF